MHPYQSAKFIARFYIIRIFMKNVLEISDYAAPYMGNFIPSLEQIEYAWKSRGKTVFILPDNAEKFSWIADFKSKHKVYFVPRSFFSKKISIYHIKLLIKIIKKENIRVVHTHFIQSNYNLFIASWFLRDVKFVESLHNHYIDRGKLKLVKRWVFKHTYDKVIGDSESVTKSAIAIGEPASKTITIKNCVVFSRLNDYDNVDFKENGRFDYTILMFGYPWYRKGVDVVVKALQTLNETMSIRLLIAQAGCEDSTKQAIMDNLGFIPQWVTFLPPTDRLADLYNSVDIFISAGREEGLSYAPIEASYCTCGVICSNIQGNPLDIPYVGVYEVENSVQLAEEVRMMLSMSDDMLDARKREQRKYVLQEYDIDKWAVSIIACYV